VNNIIRPEVGISSVRCTRAESNSERQYATAAVCPALLVGVIDHATAMAADVEIFIHKRKVTR
jgi:hypothetical protein